MPMETGDFTGRTVLNAYKLSLKRQIEENNRRVQEYYKRLQDQQKEREALKQDEFRFVCDWQSANGASK